MLRHQFTQKGKPVHPRHFHIQNNDIGAFVPHFLGRDKGINRGGHHLQIRV